LDEAAGGSTFGGCLGTCAAIIAGMLNTASASQR
jgi:hypothetical protein